ncbi:MAG: peptidase S41 [Beggiatoa sp. IS2]|nr:MAG: peptidase S41 [Beggiatoa sp. IS2]
MRTLWRYMPSLLIGATLGLLIAVGGGVLAEREQTDVTKIIPFDELRTFAEVFQKIKNDYVEEVDDKTLLEHAIQGMLSGLDPHSSYLTADEYQELQVGTSGEFGGLGIEVGMDDGFVKVIAPIDDTPAQRAGIKTGDIIIRLDDTPVKGMTLSEAVKVMRGKPGSHIRLTIVRENEDKPLKIDIVRDVIQVKSVKSRSLEPGYGYVRISHFQAHTGDDLNKVITDLKKEFNGKMKGLVLDLRNNPGGVLNAAVAVSDAFLSNGLIVYTEGRVTDAYLKFKARPNDILEGAPIVVLVNGGSASASEIVAGALQDHKRAVIMGSKTFGKGSVQTILPMNNNAALKLTTARYYTPSGRSIQAEGIKPDIELSNVEVSAIDKDDDLGLKESDLARHLRNEKKENPSTDVSDKTDGKGDKSETPKKEEPLAKTDYAIYEALNLLKGLNIVESVRK